jgi:hypothetical protein
MARKHRFRFGFHDVFAGRLRVAQVSVGVACLARSAEGCFVG